jgi:DNA repair protein RecN (Recombination protein N)
MLTKLIISNYALIHELSVEFQRGLNTVTGETGAGKSIILGALGLILGNRADLSVLKNRDRKCIVEGHFDIRKYKLRDFFQKNDLDYDDLTIFRREITASGKSRSFINDTPVTLKIMGEAGLKLIDIHSQHQNLELSNQKFQMDLVDTVASTGNLLNEYAVLYKQYTSLKKDLSELRLKAEKESSDLDYFQFQYGQLLDAALQESEQDELESELEKLTHAEEIKGSLTDVLKLLDNENFSIIQNLKECYKKLTNTGKYIDDALKLAERLQVCQIELKDILDETDSLSEKTEYDPARIELVNDRLNLIYSLEQKHHLSSVKELISLKESFREKIDQVTGYDGQINELTERLNTTRNELQRKADELTVNRKSSFKEIEDSVMTVLGQLGISKSKFIIRHQPVADFSPTGKDSVEFLFSANPDVPPAEISRIASGGEMSRLMLAIKNLLRTSRSLPTIIFDEIDSGVSGEIALKMGNILKDFSSSAQIINITHLPQIAAMGDAHFKVFKFEKEGITYTSVRLLDQAERVEELAKMVGGENLTDSVIKTARELLNN